MVDDFENKGYTFGHIAEMHTIPIGTKLDFSYNFYIKKNMHAVEKKLKMIIAKNLYLISKLDSSKLHPLIRIYSNIPFTN